jgi:hypothetical protein
MKLANECELIAARIHPSYQKEENKVAAMMRGPAGMTKSFIDDLYCLKKNQIAARLKVGPRLIFLLLKDEEEKARTDDEHQEPR